MGTQDVERMFPGCVAVSHPWPESVGTASASPRKACPPGEDRPGQQVHTGFAMDSCLKHSVPSCSLQMPDSTWNREEQSDTKSPV